MFVSKNTELKKNFVEHNFKSWGLKKHIGIIN